MVTRIPFVKNTTILIFIATFYYHYYYTFDVQPKLQQVAIDNIDDHTCTTQYYTYKGLPFEVFPWIQSLA